jgi:hypothetical protein
VAARATAQPARMGEARRQRVTLHHPALVTCSVLAVVGMPEDEAIGLPQHQHVHMLRQRAALLPCTVTLTVVCLSLFMVCTANALSVCVLAPCSMLRASSPAAAGAQLLGQGSSWEVGGLSRSSGAEQWALTAAHSTPSHMRVVRDPGEHVSKPGHRVWKRMCVAVWGRGSTSPDCTLISALIVLKRNVGDRADRQHSHQKLTLLHGQHTGTPLEGIPALATHSDSICCTCFEVAGVCCLPLSRPFSCYGSSALLNLAV